MRLLTALLVMLLASSAVSAQNFETKSWRAAWIACPGEPASDYGVYLFRKTVDLKAVKAAVPVYVSGDNRYKLYVNGTLVSVGPGRGDAMHWRYEQVDIAKYLHEGRNAIAAIVWNDGKYRPKANMTFRTGFLLQSVDNAYKVMNTDKQYASGCRSYPPWQRCKSSPLWSGQPHGYLWQ